MSLTALILTYNEEAHIARCIRSLGVVTDFVSVVDSYSTDGTVQIARDLGAKVLQHPWENYADQFQWGIDHCKFGTDWLMRMDCDEYLEPELQRELIELLPSLPEEIVGIYIRRKVLFSGQWIRHGGFYPTDAFENMAPAGQGRIEQRWMDEHIVLPERAKTITLKRTYCG